MDSPNVLVVYNLRVYNIQADVAVLEKIETELERLKQEKENRSISQEEELVLSDGIAELLKDESKQK